MAKSSRALHVAFGVIPRYHHETALPDWSIGLEMQFYAVFPFIAILLSRIGPIKGSAILTAGCCLLWAVIPSFMGLFVMPTFLPLKLTIFLAGILLAETLFCEQRRVIPLVIAAVILCTLPLFEQFGVRSMAMRIVLAAVLALLAAHGRLPLPLPLQKTIQRISSAFGSRIGHFLGEISYGTYLTHSLIIPPVLAALRVNGWNPAVTTLALLLIVVPVTFTLASILHVGIEGQGIAFGRRCIERLKTPKSVPQIAEA
jgi:peptidoglycan/LPS O-acetylase OafA/YrhL